MHKRWLEKPIPSDKEVEQLSQAINVNPYLSTLLIQRGIKDFQTAKDFFRPSLDHLHDPFLMKDMDEAVKRLRLAIEKGEKILIYGDYDVDGTTAVTLLYDYLKEISNTCEIYIPDRHTEGYGISQMGVEFAAKNGYSLIVALDCGIKASDMVKLAADKDIDFIICDHHLPGADIPAAVAVLDPKRADCPYPYKELSGCGIGFKLAHAYALRYGDEREIFSYLDLVAISIASDIVPITGENRVLTYFGLKKLDKAPRPGLKALKEISGFRQPMDVTAVVFSLGPRINAAGRIAHGSAAVKLLSAKTEEEANLLAEKLDVKNEVRKQVDSDITEEAIAMIEENDAVKKTHSTVLFKNTWHKGVIGIVAARCVEKYYRPTIILTESNNKVTGSARSVAGFDLYNAIQACSDLLEKFGGHKYAAGLTLDARNVNAFRDRFEDVVAASITEEMLTPLIEISLQISFDVITPKFISILKQMAPFGPKNEQPVFMATNIHVVNSLASFKDRHVRFLAGQNKQGRIFQVIGFDQIAYYNQLAEGVPFRMAFTIEENTYNGQTSIQLRAKDFKFE